MAATAILAPPLRRRGLARIERFVGNIVWAFLALFVLGIGGLAVYTHTGHGALTPVLSGSMQPGIQAGDVVVTHRVPVASLHVGDIIVFIPPGSTQARVHRIATLEKAPGGIAVTTKGDHNSAADPWGKVIIKGNTYKVAFVVPKIGWLVGNGGLRWLMTGFVFFAAAIVARWTWKYVRS